MAHCVDGVRDNFCNNVHTKWRGPVIRYNLDFGVWN